MNGWMNRLFRRAQPVQVITESGVFLRRGIVQAIGQNTDLNGFESTRYGALYVPLYRYTGDARELVSRENAVIVIDREKYTVLHAKEIRGFCGAAYIEAVLERQVSDNDGQ